MPKRVTWFVVGAAAGATGSVYAKRKARQAVERMQPNNVAGRGGAGSQLGPRRWSTPLTRGPDGHAGQGGRAAREPRPSRGPHRQPEPRAAAGPDDLVVENAAVLDGDEFRARRGGPRRRSRR